MAEANQSETEAEYECKHCGAESDELVAEACEESGIGFHKWNHTDRSKVAGTDATVVNKPEDDRDDETDEWRTMTADEAKKADGYRQVEGLIWEKDR